MSSWYSMVDLMMRHCLVIRTTRDDGNCYGWHDVMIGCSMKVNSLIATRMDNQQWYRWVSNVEIVLGNWSCQHWMITDEHFDVSANVPDDSRTILVHALRWVWSFERVLRVYKHRDIDDGRRPLPMLRVVHWWKWFGSDVVYVLRKHLIRFRRHRHHHRMNYLKKNSFIS